MVASVVQETHGVLFKESCAFNASEELGWSRTGLVGLKPCIIREALAYTSWSCGGWEGMIFKSKSLVTPTRFEGVARTKPKRTGRTIIVH